MMSASESRKRLLAEDGELGESIEAGRLEAEPHGLAVYCTACGTANRPEARFCRACGTSLDDQVVDAELEHVYRGSAKTKNEKAGKALPKARPPMTIAMALLEAFTALIALAATYLLAAETAAPGLAIPVLIAWFMVVAARHGALD